MSSVQKFGSTESLWKTPKIEKKKEKGPLGFISLKYQTEVIHDTVKGQ